MALIDLVGKKFGRLTVIKQVPAPAHVKRQKQRWWLCQCDCGNTTIVETSRINNGYVKSCGCLAKEMAAKRLKKYNRYELDGEYGIGYTSNGYPFYFDLSDYDLIKEYCWHRHQDGYLRTCLYTDSDGHNHYALMHRLIMGLDSGEIDHINGAPNDNRRDNLRIVTHSQNMMNTKLHANNSSGVTGVTWCKAERKYKAGITAGGVKHHLGTFASFEDAKAAREAAEQLYFGEQLRAPEYQLNGTR